MRALRLPNNPIIVPEMDARMGTNVNGPSLIRAPEWLPGRLGEFYLYFAHHQGQYIRLAYADDLAGPWHLYEPGTLTLEESIFRGHIASPDVHVDEERRQIRMYYHGVARPGQEIPRRPETVGVNQGQVSTCAVSADGLHFSTLQEVMATSYMRAWRWGGYWYALSMPGLFFRSRDGLSGWEAGPSLFDRDFRHAAVMLDGDVLSVFYSHVGDTPERILLARIRLTPDWMGWRADPPETVLAPEEAWEGADLPLEPSVRGWAPQRVRQLRDPAVYRDEGGAYLLYSVAGEHGIAIARLVED